MDGVKVRHKMNPRDGSKVRDFCFTNYLKMKKQWFFERKNNFSKQKSSKLLTKIPNSLYNIIYE